MNNEKVAKIIENFEKRTPKSSSERQAEGLELLVNIAEPALKLFNSRKFFLTYDKYMESHSLSNEESKNLLLIPKMIDETIFNADELLAMALTEDIAFIEAVFEAFNELDKDNFSECGKNKNKEMMREAIIVAAQSLIV